ncbi:MAG TPA: DNA breaking-rejoining protein [Candidatus Dormibacteraeota bacterium]|nr:DNA breaking-rejoining protein [Candidatus Dormibacteraeota bacterium]
MRTVSALAGILLAAATARADGIRKQPVHFAPGKSSATISGTITGDQIVDYVLDASAGQQMNVALKSSNGSMYFNVLPPGSEQAIFDGSPSGNTWSGALVRDGEYSVRVFPMRTAAHRDEKASYTLSIGVSGSKAER